MYLFNVGVLLGVVQTRVVSITSKYQILLTIYLHWFQISTIVWFRYIN